MDDILIRPAMCVCTRVRTDRAVRYKGGRQLARRQLCSSLLFTSVALSEITGMLRGGEFALCVAHEGTRT